MADGGSSNGEVVDEMRGLTLGGNVDNVASVGNENSAQGSRPEGNASARESRKEFELVAPISKDIEKYTMSKEKRGVAFIFNHTTYDLRDPKPQKKEKKYTLDDRTGTNDDKEKLLKTFTNLGFDVRDCMNCTWTEIENILTPPTPGENDSRHLHKLTAEDVEKDCIVVAVLTHGGKKGYLEAKDKGYHVSRLFELLSGIEKLEGKPKLFFIQVSRAKRTYRHYQKPNDGRGPSQAIICAGATLPDFLMSFEGQYGYGNLQEGSPCTTLLCQLLNNLPTDMDLVKLLTLVNREVAQRFSTTSHCFTSSLTKNLYL